VTSDPVGCQRSGDAANGAGIGCGESKSPVRPVPVVVTDVDNQDMFEVGAADNENVVEALSPDGADPMFGVGVRDRGPHRRADDMGTNRTPHVVEGPGELDFVSRSRIRWRGRAPRSSIAEATLRAC